ncbi:hypothetical protein Aperf_G00000009292 [Anoplocephala perfoliata]
MGIINSRAADSSRVDDRHPILEGDYNASEYCSESSCHRHGVAPSLQSQVLCSCKARLLNDTGRQVSNGTLELTYSDLKYLYTERNVSKTATWPLSGLRGYGYRENLFTFEAGRRCLMPGIFIFKCKRAHFLHMMLSVHVNRLAQMVPHHIDPCNNCRPCLNHDSWRADPHVINSSRKPSALTGNVAEVRPSDSQRRRARTPPPPYSASTQTTSGWPPALTYDGGQRRRWRLSDYYIYLSSTLPPPSPSPQLRHLHNPAMSSSATSLPASSPPSAGGVYLVAIPNFTSAHSYENQHTLFVASSCA